MNFSSIENYLFHLSQPSGTKNRDSQKYRFERIHCVLNLLDHPEQKIPHYIHITGTSGKGSVAIMLATILRTAGHKTGLIISPHPTYLRERWQINNQPISTSSFTELFTTIYQAIKKYERSAEYKLFGAVSYSDLMSIIGLAYFAKEHVTHAVIEVGIGGRRDSTNSIPYKDLAIITNIDLDHTSKLGPTKAAIAREKLGIIRPRIPLFTAERDQPILTVMKKECQKHSSPFYPVKPSFILASTDLQGSTFTYQHTSYHLPVLGKHQIHNAILAIEAARYLRIDRRAIQQALPTISLPIRCEVISEKPLIILDSAHNRDKIKSTVETVAALLNPPTPPDVWSGQALLTVEEGKASVPLLIKRGVGGVRHLYLLLALSSRRDLVKKLKPLTKLHPDQIIVTRTDTTLSPHLFYPTLKKLFPSTDIHIEPDYQKAFKQVKRILKKDDLFLVTGSVYLSGALKIVTKKTQ